MNHTINPTVTERIYNEKGNRHQITIENTRFLHTNFSGDPARSKNGYDTKCCAIIIDEMLAQDLIDLGLNIGVTRNYNDDPDFVPEYILNVNVKWHETDGLDYLNPEIYLFGIGCESAVRMDSESSAGLDKIKLGTTHITVSICPSDRSASGWATYLKSAVIWQSASGDPIVNKYIYGNNTNLPLDEQIPFN